MKILKYFHSALLCFLLVAAANANVNPITKNSRQKKKTTKTINFLANCQNAYAQTDLAINNVRARLTTGGDLWWNGSQGRYVVPKVPPGVPEVSSIYAAGVWIGGLDDGGNLKVAAQTYGRSAGNFDFWPGPLIATGENQGQTDETTCSNWDRFFKVTAEDIDAHRDAFYEAKNSGGDYLAAEVPESVKGWPAKGNPYFYDIHQFNLPETSQGLAGFHDYDGDGMYDPVKGDYPIIEMRNYPDFYYGDEMIFWIFNDAGNSHFESGSPLALNMEVQAQAFAFQTEDEINDMTFVRYKMINRAITSIDSTYFALWVDPDLGCPTDDYIGCDPERGLAYVYNADEVDGTDGCECDVDVNTYCDEVPILGIDILRGPHDSWGNELKMTSFTYYYNGGVVDLNPGVTDPQNEQGYYNYMSGSWKDGSFYQDGGNGYQQGTEPVKFVFPDAPDDEEGWSMCTVNPVSSDIRMVQSSGSFRMDPGTVQELVVGVMWLPDQNYPCPSIRRLQEVDDKLQFEFDKYIDFASGPDAPDMEFIELDQEIITILSNNDPSNNIDEAYEDYQPTIPIDAEDDTYKFEGYRIYQLSGPEISLWNVDREDSENIRLVAEVDVKNGVRKIFNWESLDENSNPFEQEFHVPVLMVEGADEGIRHTFKITEDQFAEGDRKLINHKRYYFVAIAYAYNEYEPFDPGTQAGQKSAYLESRKNIGPFNDGRPFTVIPRPVVDKTLNAVYGSSPIVTRIDGTGTGANFLDLSDETRTAIQESFLMGNAIDEITYKPGRSPVDIFVYNPLEVYGGNFELSLTDDNPDNEILEHPIYWKLKNLSDPQQPEIIAERSIDQLNEQVLKQYGFSIAIKQEAEAGAEPLTDITNGALGYEEVYANGSDSIGWLSGIPDDFSTVFYGELAAVFDFIKTENDQEFEADDPNRAFADMGRGIFVPYYLCNWTGNNDPYPEILTPAWTNTSNLNQVVHGVTSLGDLNNVDIVFTSEKELWSRCVIVETANKWMTNAGMVTVGEDITHFDLRGSPSVTKFDLNNDGMPDVDENSPIALGMGWFPGYAVDVETGQRLNIFFGENSIYNSDFSVDAFDQQPTGADMMFNPTSQLYLQTQEPSNPVVLNYYAGGQHYVYVTKQPYDGCADIAEKLNPQSLNTEKVIALREVTWTGLVMPAPEHELLSYKNGLIPEDVIVKLRAKNPYKVAIGTGEFNGYPTYRFSTGEFEPEEQNEKGISDALDQINVVPNPYFLFSDYEQTAESSLVKITNLPNKCKVSIYTLNGNFVRQFNRNVTGAREDYTYLSMPDIEWDLTDANGVQITAGVYLIHIEAEGLGERTLKWFGVHK